MSRKHYEKIAKTINEHRSIIGVDNLVDFVHDLCVIFEEDNDRFDSDRFKEAIGII